MIEAATTIAVNDPLSVLLSREIYTNPLCSRLPPLLVAKIAPQDAYVIVRHSTSLRVSICYDL